MNFQIFLRDAFNNLIVNGTMLSVQSLDVPVFVTEENGQLWFSPYGKKELVKDYFKQDLEVL